MLSSSAGLNSASFSNFFVRPAPAGSSGTSENFVRIGHSLLALITALPGRATFLIPPWQRFECRFQNRSILGLDLEVSGALIEV